MKKIAIVITLLLALGCSPKQDYGKIYEVNDKITSLRGCSEQYQNGCFKSEELLFILGEPDKRILMKDFHGLIVDDWNASSESGKHADDELYRLYRSYLHRYKPAENFSNSVWDSNDHFLNLDLWFYVFQSGPEFFVGGIFPKSTGMFNAYYYVIDNDFVILVSNYARPIKKRHE